MRIIVTKERDELYSLLNIEPNDVSIVIFVINEEFFSALEQARSNIMPFYYAPDLFPDEKMEEIFLAGMKEYAEENPDATVIVTADEEDYEKFLAFIKIEELYALKMHTIEYVSFPEDRYELDFFTFILIWYDNAGKTYWVRDQLFDFLGNILAKEREFLSTAKDMYIDNSSTSNSGIYVGSKFDPRDIPTSKN